LYLYSAVVFILEEFDLFTLKGQHSKQTLLYAVLDLLQQEKVQAAVVGVTCRHDAATLLEKRVLVGAVQVESSRDPYSLKAPGFNP
jgi:hypothetical protein